MRTTYYEELSALSTQVGEMCGLAADAMEHATEALLGRTFPWPNKSSPTMSTSWR